jgi:hypothetical protein
MSYIFGDGFDLYASTTDAGLNYWDSASSSILSVGAGRFTGSQAVCMVVNGSTGLGLYKSSGSNDAAHHIVCSFTNNVALSGTVSGMYIQLLDGATPQCSIVFRSDGTILLTSGGPTGSTLATYSSAFSASTWTAYEFEVVINNSTGSFAVRKNGSGSNDFSATGLNTRGGTANNYANRLAIGTQTVTGAPFNGNTQTQRLDDVLWRSDSSAPSWVGDVRCYTRMPASDVSTQFTRNASTFSQTPVTAGGSTAGTTIGQGRYIPFTAQFDGTVGSASVSLSTGYTGNMKCSIFASSGSAPTTVLGSATAISNPVTGNNSFTFGTPVSVTRGTQYYLGFCADSGSGIWNIGSGGTGLSDSGTYASFPRATPSTASTQGVVGTWTITVTSNAAVVADTTQDSTTSYVSDSTATDADFYNLGSISLTPASTIAVTTRGFAQKTDAGSRVGGVQLKSASTTVQATGALNTTFSWLWRTDTVDPATSAAWTAAAVNAATIGPTVVS